MKMPQGKTGVRDNLTGWIVSYSRQNYWRVPCWMDVDDLIQEGMVIALKCRARYGDELDERHYMALVKSGFHNRVRDLYIQAGGFKTDGTRRESRSAVMVPLETIENSAGTDDASFGATLAGAPKAVQAVLSLLKDADKLAQLCSASDKVRQDDSLFNKLLCKLVGTNPQQVNLVNEVREYFSA